MRRMYSQVTPDGKKLSHVKDVYTGCKMWFVDSSKAEDSEIIWMKL